MLRMAKRDNPQKFLLLVVFCLASLIYLSRSKDHDYEKHGKKNDVEDAFSQECNASLPKWFTDLERDVHQTQSRTPVIYFVTPTFTRREQAAELIRLGQTLLHVPTLVWIVAEDSLVCSPLVQNILRQFGHRLAYAHLSSPMPDKYRKAFYKPRGVSSRNAGLKWIEDNHPGSVEGVVYFADDDNTYDLRLFDEMRWTQKVSMFPVGLIGKQGVSSPIVRDGVVVGFTDPWFERRKFPVDMAGFAVNVQLVQKSKARMPFKAGHEEDLFLRALGVSMRELEPKAKGCTEIYVWHTQTAKTRIPIVRRPEATMSNSLTKLLQELEQKGVLKLADNGREVPVCLKEACRTG